MKTILKKNHLPFLSVLPFCLMAASVACYPLDSLAAEYVLDNGYTGGTLFLQQESGNTLIIKGSLSPTEWIICAGYSSTINASSNSVTSEWGDQEIEIEKGILGGFVTDYSNEEKLVSASSNQIILNKNQSPKVVVFGDIKAAIATGIGWHNAEQNKVNLSGITVSGGGYMGRTLRPEKVKQHLIL